MKVVFSTTPKKFSSANRVRQTNSLASLSNLRIDKEIILFGEADDREAIETCKKYNIKYLTDFKRSGSGVPFVNDLFQRTLAYTEADFYCYINCDIIVLDDFCQTLKILYQKNVKNKTDSIFACGQRWDSDSISEVINFQEFSDEKILSIAKQTGRMHEPTGIDYFIFQKRTFSNMPDLLIARAVFDNLIVGHAVMNNNIDEYDVSSMCTVIHQNHKYGQQEDITDLSVLKSKFKDDFKFNQKAIGYEWGPMRFTSDCKKIS